MTATIKSYTLDRNYLFIHKEAITTSDFGLDNSYELIENGFGIYSSERVKDRIGPLKSNFFRIALCRKGTVTVDCGIETFIHSRNTMHFNFPSQVFSLYNKSEDMFAYYILFTEQFIEDLLPIGAIQKQFNFFDFHGVPFFELTEEEGLEAESLFLKINTEIKNSLPALKQSIQLYVNLLLITANRSYIRQQLTKIFEPNKENNLVVRYKKLISQHFITKRNLSDYADMLNISINHLSKTVKEITGCTAGSFIDNMLTMEAKALLRHTELSIAEISYQLDFSDPSYFNKFFKKETNTTPMQYRHQQ